MFYPAGLENEDVDTEAAIRNIEMMNDVIAPGMMGQSEPIKPLTDLEPKPGRSEWQY